MKRLMLLLAAFVAFGAIAASTAAADHGTPPAAPPVSITLTSPVTDLVLPQDETTVDVTIAGTFIDGSWNHQTHEVTVSYFANGTCSGTAYHQWTFDTAKETGAFPTGHQHSPTLSLPVGVYSFLAVHESEHAASLTGHEGGTSDAAHVCLRNVTVSPTPVTPPAEPVTPPVAPVIPPDPGASSFLCWNHEMVNPVAYLDTIADELWATGKYFEPVALPGTVVGGTNVGGYHLVCNAPTTATATGEVVGGSGEVYNSALNTLIHASHPGGNDLNVYHIAKMQ